MKKILLTVFISGIFAVGMQLPVQAVFGVEATPETQPCEDNHGQIKCPH